MLQEIRAGGMPSLTRAASPRIAYLHALLGIHQSSGSGFFGRSGGLGGSIMLLLQTGHGSKSTKQVRSTVHHL